MRFLREAFRIQLKSALTWQFLMAAALFPAAILALGLLFNNPGGVSIQIGILHSGDPVSTHVENSLRAYGGMDWTIVTYTDIEQLRQDVAARRLELGYVLMESGTIHVYISPATMTSSVSNLLVAAAYLETIAGEIGAETLAVHIEAEAEFIQARAESYLAYGPLMERILIVHGTAGEVTEAAPYRRLFHGLTVLFAWALALLYAMNNDNAAFRRVQMAGRGLTYILSGVGTVYVLCGVVVFVTIAAGEWLYPGIWMGHEFLAILAYLWAISGLAVLLSFWLREELFPPIFSLLFLAKALIGGVIFDLREILDTVSFIRFLFPSHYYMMAVEAPNLGAVGVLFMVGLIAITLAVTKGRKKI